MVHLISHTNNNFSNNNHILDKLSIYWAQTPNDIWTRLSTSIYISYIIYKSFKGRNVLCWCLSVLCVLRWGKHFGSSNTNKREHHQKGLTSSDRITYAWNANNTDMRHWGIWYLGFALTKSFVYTIYTKREDRRGVRDEGYALNGLKIGTWIGGHLDKYLIIINT
jgi:hypothetical protein